jgi:hypothetical protein
MFFKTCVAGSLTGTDFCLIFAPWKATMSQKSSLPQPTQSVSWVLTADSPNTLGLGLHSNPCTVGDDEALADFAEDLADVAELAAARASPPAAAPRGAGLAEFDAADRVDRRAWWLGPDLRSHHDLAIAGPAV